MKAFLITLILGVTSVFAQDKPESPMGPEPKAQLLKMRAKSMLIEGEGKRNRAGISGEMNRMVVVCPLCKNDFQAVNLEDRSANKGRDRDFCPHNSFKSGLDFDIWTCPDCGYSHHKSFFHQLPETPEGFDLLLRKQLKEEFSRQYRVNIQKLGYTLDQEDIPRSTKYLQLHTLMPYVDLPWKVMADLHLKTAWSERLRLCEPVVQPTLSKDVGIINEAFDEHEKRLRLDTPMIQDPAAVIVFLDEKMKKSISDRQTFLLHIYKAGQLTRLGHPQQASRELKKAVMMKLPKEMRSIATFKTRLLESESRHLKEAIIATKEAIRAGEHLREEIESTIYLLGELQRRIGLFAEAALWFDQAMESSPEPLRTWAKEQRALLPPNPGLAPDSEKILIQRALDQLKKSAVANSDGPIDPATISPQRVRRWLWEIHLAAIHYRRTYGLDPESLMELHELKLLAGQPDLTLPYLRAFNLDVDRNQAITSLRYTVRCILPVKSDNGAFMLSLTRGEYQSQPTL